MSDIETCSRCGRQLKSRAELAEILERVRDDARAAVSEHEPTDDRAQGLEAEADYVDVAIDQVVSELKGVCSECWEGPAD